MASSSNQEETVKKKLAFLLNPLFVYCFQEIPKKKEEQIQELLEDHPTIRRSFKSFLKNQEQTGGVPNTHNSVLISQLQGIPSTHKMSSQKKSQQISSSGYSGSGFSSSSSSGSSDFYSKEQEGEREVKLKKQEDERKKKYNALAEIVRKAEQTRAKGTSSVKESLTKNKKPSTEGKKTSTEGKKTSTEGKKTSTEGKKTSTEGKKPSTTTAAIKPLSKEASDEKLKLEHGFFAGPSLFDKVTPKDVSFENPDVSSVLELAIQFPVFIRKPMNMEIFEKTRVLVLFFKAIRTAFHKASLGNDLCSFPFDEVLHFFIFLRKEILNDDKAVQRATIKLYKIMRGIDPETVFFLSTESLGKTIDMIQKELDACISKVAIFKTLSTLKEPQYLSEDLNAVLVESFKKPITHEIDKKGSVVPPVSKKTLEKGEGHDSKEESEEGEEGEELGEPPVTEEESKEAEDPFLKEGLKEADDHDSGEVGGIGSRLKRLATQRRADTEPSRKGSVGSRIVKKKAFNESSNAAHATTMNGKKNEQSASKPTRDSSNVWRKPVIESPLLKSHV